MSIKKKYPEIAALQNLVKKHQFALSVLKEDVLAKNEAFPRVKFRLSGKIFSIYIDDEYDDLKSRNITLSLCLILRSLESYTEAENYSVWARQHQFDAANTHVRHHYLNLGKHYKVIEQIIGPINSHISDLDFELNAGSAQILRELK